MKFYYQHRTRTGQELFNVQTPLTSDLSVNDLTSDLNVNELTSDLSLNDSTRVLPAVLPRHACQQAPAKFRRPVILSMYSPRFKLSEITISVYIEVGG